MKRILALLLILCMCLPFAACGGTEDPDDKPPVTPPPDETVFIDAVGEHDFGGEEFVISALQAYEAEIYKEEEEPDAFNEATKKRNQLLEDRFHVEIVPVIFNAGNANDHSAAICRELMNNNPDTLDMVLMQMWLAGPVMMTGFLYDLRAEVPYVKDVIGQVDYWSANTNNCYSVYGRQYIGVSDINISAVSHTWAMLFNQDLDDNYSVARNVDADYSSIYDIVDDGKWTLDTMTKIVKDFWYDDPTGAKPNERDMNDTFGLLYLSFHGREIFTNAFGYDLVVNDGYTTPELMTMTTNMATKISEIKDLFATSGFNSFTEAGDSGANPSKMFADGKSLLYMCTLAQLDGDTIHETDVKFGVIPYPKAEERQKAYYAGTQDSMSTILAPLNLQERLTMAGAMIEALAAESHQSCLPAYYEVILKYNATRDERSVGMIEKIYEGRRYNLAGIHSSSSTELRVPSGGGLAYIFRDLTRPSATNAADFWASAGPSYQLRLDDLIAVYESMLSFA